MSSAEAIGGRRGLLAMPGSSALALPGPRRLSFPPFETRHVIGRSHQSFTGPDWTVQESLDLTHELGEGACGIPSAGSRATATLTYTDDPLTLTTRVTIVFRVYYMGWSVESHSGFCAVSPELWAGADLSPATAPRQFVVPLVIDPSGLPDWSAPWATPWPSVAAGRSAIFACELSAFEIPTASAEDLMFSSQGVASASSAKPDFPASNLDFYNGSPWESLNQGAPGDWCMLDLGSPDFVSSVRVVATTAANALIFDLEVSNDLLTWTTLQRGRGAVLDDRFVTGTGMPYRYWRILATSGATDSWAISAFHTTFQPRQTPAGTGWPAGWRCDVDIDLGYDTVPVPPSSLSIMPGIPTPSGGQHDWTRTVKFYVP